MNVLEFSCGVKALQAFDPTTLTIEVLLLQMYASTCKMKVNSSKVIEVSLYELFSKRLRCKQQLSFPDSKTYELCSANLILCTDGAKPRAHKTFRIPESTAVTVRTLKDSAVIIIVNRFSHLSL